MKTSFAVAVALAAIPSTFALAAPSVLAGAAPPQAKGAAQCIASAVDPGTKRVILYVTPIFPMPNGQPASLNGAWAAFVKSTYHLDKMGAAACSPFSTDPGEQKQVVATEEGAWTKNGIQIVHVDLQNGQATPTAPKRETNPYAAAGAGAPAAAPAKDAGAKDAPPADAAPPADQGPPPRASYCYSDDKKTPIYFSDAFDTADLPSSKAWSAAFAKFLAMKYMYKGAVTCKDMPTISKIQSAVLDQKDALQGKETIDTDWTYEPPAPGEAPTADAAPAAPPAATKPAKTTKSTTPKPH